MKKEKDEKLVCCECGSDRVEFCALGWFDAKTQELNTIADLGGDYRRELYCRNCKNSINNFIYSYEFDPLKIKPGIKKSRVLDKNCNVKYYTVMSYKKKEIEHNENGEMICCYCKSNNVEYSVYAWFDLNTEKFVEYAENPQELSYTSVWCNDCDKLFPEDYPFEEYTLRFGELMKEQSKTQKSQND